MMVMAGSGVLSGYLTFRLRRNHSDDMKPPFCANTGGTGSRAMKW